MSKENMLKNIVAIFTAEDQQDIKNSFKQLLLDQFKSDLEQLDVYLFDPKDIEEIINEMILEITEEIKGEIKETLKNKVLQSLDMIDLKNLIK